MFKLLKNHFKIKRVLKKKRNEPLDIKHCGMYSIHLFENENGELMYSLIIDGKIPKEEKE